MDITIQQFAFIQRTFLAMYLCLDIPRAQVEHEETLQSDAAVLDPAREDDTDEYRNTNSHDQGAGELAQVVADIEDGR